MTGRPVDDAVAAYRELGWDRLPMDQLPTADLGTPDQRRRAKNGCRSGTWAEWGALPSGEGGMVSLIGQVDLARFAVFAIRMGVDGARAAAVVDLRPIPDAVLIAVATERGPTFCSRFVERVSSGRARWHGRKTKVCVELVVDLGLPIPDNAQYRQGWVSAATVAVEGLQPWERFTSEDVTIPSDRAVIARFAEHIRGAVAAGVPMGWDLQSAARLGLARGLIDRDEMVGLCFAGLDRARRPSERAAWVSFLTEDLVVTDDEIVDRAEELIPALSTGAPETIDNLGLVLLAQAPEELLPDLATTMLTAAASRRLRTSIVDTLADRTKPGPVVVQKISDVLTTFDAKAIVPKSLAALTAAWAMDDVEPAPPPTVNAPWRPTTPVWSVPRFFAGRPSPDLLVEALRPVVAGPQEIRVTTVESERVLSLLIQCAAADLDATRSAVRGVRYSWAPGLSWIRHWLEGDRFEASSSRRALPELREMAVVERAGEIPCLLSEPSWDDLRIDVADLAARLDRYVQARVDVCETDLLLALTRTDPATVTADQLADLRRCHAGVTLLHQQRSKRTAGEWIGLWFDDPITEPALVDHGGNFAWRAHQLDIPQALRSTFSRFVEGPNPTFDFWEFPTWGDAAMLSIGNARGGPSDDGVLLRQLVRLGRPLPPGAAINLLAAQRDPHPAAAADTQQAVLDAFDRGILRPESIDVRLLDWSSTPRSLAAFGRAMRELAEFGLTSIIWQVVDDLINVSAAAPTVTSGTEVLADLIADLLPSVRSAVGSGIADPSVLALPGMRVLAARSGSGIAVKTARTVVSSLPGPDESSSVNDTAAEPPPFEQIWPPDVGTMPALDDRTELNVEQTREYWRPKGLEVSVLCDQWPGRSFSFSSDNGPLLVRTGRAAGMEDWTDFREVALHWDAAAGRLALSKGKPLSHPERLTPVSPGEPPPLSTALVAIVLAGIHDGDTHHAAELLRRNQFGSAAVEKVMPVLLDSEDVDPSRLVRILESAPSTLPGLWPLVTESVRAAGAIEGKLPRWANGVLTVALQVAPSLAEAVRRGLAPERAARWQGLDRIAARPGKSAAVVNAQKLQELVRSWTSLDV